MPVEHALSVDVEDWYHDSGVTAGEVGDRVERNTDRLLELFAEADSRATFFVLGDVAEKFPALLRRIHAAGHEVGSHGHHHRRVMEMTQRELREELSRSKAVLEDAIGAAVHGFRAPYFSIKADVRWPVDLVAAVGFTYDASILPIDRPPGLELVTPRAPYRLHNGMLEAPVAMLRFGPWHLPLASGAGLRLLPSAWLLSLIRTFEREIGAGLFYLHPWEIDPGSPAGEGAARWLLKAGRAKLVQRWRELADVRRFGTIRSVFRAHLDDAEAGARQR